jgi:hypothetical protein
MEIEDEIVIALEFSPMQAQNLSAIARCGCLNADASSATARPRTGGVV